MENFVRIVMEKNEQLNEGLDKSIFPSSDVYESAQGATAVSYTHLRAHET